MPHSFALFTGRWADLPLEEVARLDPVALLREYRDTSPQAR